jgi:antitoxin (DNA-binding transcriptional repressor) of toxin-antitoxin stability system
MKTVTISEFRADVDRYLAEAEREGVLLTREDKPCVLISPVPSPSDTQADDWVRSPEFWRMIQSRRSEPAIPWSEARKTLGVD